MCISLRNKPVFLCRNHISIIICCSGLNLQCITDIDGCEIQTAVSATYSSWAQTSNSWWFQEMTVALPSSRSTLKERISPSRASRSSSLVFRFQMRLDRAWSSWNLEKREEQVRMAGWQNSFQPVIYDYIWLEGWRFYSCKSHVVSIKSDECITSESPIVREVKHSKHQS